MSTLACLSCTATTTNGLALCDLCQMQLAKCLEFLPIYFRNLARWRPGTAGSRAVPGSREPRGSSTASTDRVSNALDEVGADLTAWARCLADDRPSAVLPASNDEAASVKVACWFLTENLTSVATLGWAGEAVRTISRHEASLRSLTEAVAPGWYAGACKVCESSTYVVPGLTWVTCQVCGSTTYARDHLEIVLTEARPWVARPRALAEAIVALVDTEQSVPRVQTRIRQWAHHDDLTPLRRVEPGYVYDDDEDRMVLATVEVGYPRYRLGEVLDLLLRPTHAKPTQVERVRAS